MIRIKRDRWFPAPGDEKFELEPIPPTPEIEFCGNGALPGRVVDQQNDRRRREVSQVTEQRTIAGSGEEVMIVRVAAEYARQIA